jgi:hypothetical protein
MDKAGSTFLSLRTHDRWVDEAWVSSIIPCLALRGVATGIAQSPSLKVKVLLRELPVLL